MGVCTDNPVLVLEMRQRRRRRAWRLWPLLMSSAAAIQLIVLTRTAPDWLRRLSGRGWDGWMQTIWLWIWVWLLAHWAPPFETAPLLAGERESNLLDAVLLTPLTTVEIWWGKLWAAAGPMALAMVSTAPVIILSGALGLADLGASIALPLYSLLVIMSGGSVGLCVSAFARTIDRAAQGAAVMVFVVLPMAACLMLSLTQSAGRSSPWFALAGLSVFHAFVLGVTAILAVERLAGEHADTGPV